MWINDFNFRRRAAQTAPCLAQCVKYSDSFVGAMSFTPTTAAERTVFDAMREVFVQSCRR